MKDPAFLFYSQDFFMGVQLMSFEDRGKYITLLCLMHQHGRMTEERVGLLVGSVSVSLKAKFQIDDSGNWYSERLEKEIEKRAAYLEKQRQNGSKGGRPKNPKDKPEETQGLTQTQTQKKPIIEDENEIQVLNQSNAREKLIRNGTPNKIKETAEAMIEVVLPWPSDEFAEQWKIWKEFKQKQFKFKYVPIGEQAALKELSEISEGIEGVAIAIIHQSMSNGWKGLFKLKAEDKNGTGRNGTRNSLEGAKRALDRVCRE